MNFRDDGGKASRGDLLVTGVIAAAGLMITLAGCNGGSDPRGERMAVRGHIMFEGRDLQRARVVFVNLDGGAKIKATGSVTNGFYEIPAERGPLAGRCRVEIQALPIDQEEFEAARRSGQPIDFNPVEIPANYGDRSELEVVVDADPLKNKFDFRLETKSSP